MNRNLLFILSCAAISACSPGIAEVCTSDTDASPVGFRGGPNEKTLGESYFPELKLPLAENDFVLLLEKWKLPYSIAWSAKDKGVSFPIPQHKRAMDSRCYKLVYDVYDPTSSGKRYAAHFSAYVRVDGKVSYVENEFQYDGP